MSQNEYLNELRTNRSTYFNEFPIKFVNNLVTKDINSFNETDSIIQKDSDDGSLSPEEEEYSLQTSMTHSPSTEFSTSTLSCRVCGAPARGYNFDQITCESCKAFFRRNALKNTRNLKCRFGGNCVINMYNRRQCTYCRLKKCFDIKMRKDWIRTEEERQLRLLKKLHKQRKLDALSSYEQESISKLPIVVRKKKRLLPLITELSKKELCLERIEPIYPINTLAIHRNLTNEDRVVLNNIVNAYKCGAEKADCSHLFNCSSSTTLVQFLNDETQMYQSLIYFFKQIPEFKLYDLADRILLIKCNILDIIHYHHVVVEHFQELPKMAENMPRWVSLDFHLNMLRERRKLTFFMKYPLVLKIALVIFIFSVNLSTPRGSSQFTDYKNKKQLIKNQNYYISLLWRYLQYLFGEVEAPKAMLLIITVLLRYQGLMSFMDEFIRKNGYQEMFNPLMQSVWRFT